MPYKVALNCQIFILLRKSFEYLYRLAMTCIPVAQVRASVEEAAKEMQAILEPASNSTGCRPARRSTVRIRKLVFSRCLLCTTCHVPTSHAISITGHTGATGLQLKACLILVTYIKDIMSKDQGLTGRGFWLRDGTGRVLAKKFGYRDGSGRVVRRF